jgi:hypothetical protein
MQFFITVPHDTATEPTMESLTEADAESFEKLFAEVQQFNADLEASGAFRFAGGLQPPSTAKTVDPTSGETKILDEPFVVAESYVGGFWVVETDTEAEAVQWAERAAGILHCRIEVRALQEQ